MEQGKKYFEKKEYHKAIEKYTSAAGACSGHDLGEEKAEALCSISLSYLKLDEPWKALVYAEWAVKLNPKSAMVCVYTQQLYIELVSS